MNRPTLGPHDGAVDNPNTFQVARDSLVGGLQHLRTEAGTSFTAQSHAPIKGNHIGQECIWIKNNGDSIAYIYESCWGHVTNYAGVYIDSYTPIL